MDIDKIIDTELETIIGFCTPKKAHGLAKLVNEYAVENFLELGVYGGRSLLPVALAVKARSATGRVVGVDAWSGSVAVEGMDLQRDAPHIRYWGESGLTNHDNMHLYAQAVVDRFGLTNTVQLVKMSSNDYHTEVPARSLDMLHQDANHTDTICCREVSQYYDKVKPGGIWVMDDTDWESTKQAQADLEKLGYTCVVDEVSWKAYRRALSL